MRLANTSSFTRSARRTSSSARTSCVRRESSVPETHSTKTRTLAALANGLSGHDRLVYVEGMQTARSAFGPFFAAMNDVEHIEPRPPSADDPTDTAFLVQRASQFRRFVDHLNKQPTVLVVDDAHWLDSQSSAFVQHLIRSDDRNELTTIIAGRPDDQSQDWVALQRSLERTGADQHLLAPLTTPDLTELIGLIHPASSYPNRLAFAAEVAASTGGVPAVARIVIEAADSVTLTSRRTSNTRSRVDLTALDRPALVFGRVAAVLENPFTFQRVSELAGLDEPALCDGLEQLLDHGLVREQSDGDALSFAHVLVRDAFLDSAPTAFRCRLHSLVAADCVDLHRRAHHEFHAWPRVPAEQAVTTLIESARTHYTAGAFREALDDIRNADLRVDGELGPDALALWAAALDRSSTNGGEWVRSKAFAAFRRNDDQEGMLSAAMSGLPVAETGSGDSARVELLLEIDPARLTPDNRYLHALETARQLTLLGRHNEAEVQLAKAQLHVDSDNRNIDIALARRLIRDATATPQDRLDNLPAPTENVSDVRRCQLHQLHALDHMSNGDLSASTASQHAFREAAQRIGDPVRIWHALVFDAVSAALRGHYQAATQQLNEVAEFGYRYGLRDAAATWAGQLFSLFWMMDTHGPIFGNVDAWPPDISDLPLALAARAVTLAEVATDESSLHDAVAEVERLCGHVLEHRPVLGSGVLILAAPVMAAHGAGELVTQVADRLRPLDGSWLVLGAGIANLGPVSLALAHLATGPTRARLYQQAVTEADDLGLLAWQIGTRLRLARADHPGDWFEEARHLATGTELESQLAAEL